MLRFVKYFKYIMVIKLNFQEGVPRKTENVDKIKYSDSTKPLSQLIKEIWKTVDWEDLRILDALKDRVDKISKSTKKELLKLVKDIKDEFREMLNKWFTVKNLKDYEALKKSLKIADIDLKLPEYKDLTKISETFSVALNNKNELELYGDWFMHEELKYITSNWEIKNPHVRLNDNVFNNNKVNFKLKTREIGSNRSKETDFWKNLKEADQYNKKDRESLKARERKEAILSKVEKWNKDMLLKADSFITFVNNNPSAKQNWIELKIEDWKITLYEKWIKKRFFTIPQMDMNWNIKHQENLAILNDFNNWMNSFVKKYFPEVKTYAEIWKENLKEQKIADIQEKSKDYNEKLINITEKSIEWLKKNFNLPDRTDLLLDWNRVVLNLPDWKKHYFTLNMKDVSWNETHPENKWRNIYWNLKKWVEKYTWELKTK